MSEHHDNCNEMIQHQLKIHNDKIDSFTGDIVKNKVEIDTLSKTCAKHDDLINQNKEKITVINGKLEPILQENDNKKKSIRRFVFGVLGTVVAAGVIWFISFYFMSISK